jgi:hypothetical protein
MIKQKTVLEVVVGERKYELLCGADSPLGDLHDALMQMKGYCIERMVKAHEEEKKIAEEMQKQCDPEGDHCC